MYDTYFFFPLEGFKGAAEKFRIESGIQPSVDLDTLDERIKIRDAIQNGKIEEAIQLVNNLHPELLDCDRYLFFHLQVLFNFFFRKLFKTISTLFDVFRNDLFRLENLAQTFDLLDLESNLLAHSIKKKRQLKVAKM